MRFEELNVGERFVVITDPDEEVYEKIMLRKGISYLGFMEDGDRTGDKRFINAVSTEDAIPTPIYVAPGILVIKQK